MKEVRKNIVISKRKVKLTKKGRETAVFFIILQFDLAYNLPCDFK